jgi:hypothetical protein
MILDTHRGPVSGNVHSTSGRQQLWLINRSVRLTFQDLWISITVNVFLEVSVRGLFILANMR